MKLIGKWIFVILLILFMSVSVAGAEDVVAKEQGAKYTIGPGDILEISVWKDEAMTKQVVVLPDGTISMPLVGEVAAADKTLEQLKTELVEKIGRYVPDPVVTVIVQRVNSLLIYLIGKVNSPGHRLLSSNINVLQALTMAGGLNPFAKRNNITIQREEGGQTRIFQFSYDEVSEGKNLEQNIRLQRGDVIIVP